MAFSQLSAAEQKALSEGSDTAGGFLVPPDTQAEMLVRLAQMSVMRRLARTVTTSRDKVVFPRVQAASATAGGVSAGGGSIFSSGFVGGWVGETPAFSDTDPAFGTFEVSIKKVRCATKLSNDWLADAVSNPLAFLAQNGAENMALVEDKGFIDGDGAALQPLGILNGGAATVDVEGTTSNTISNTSADPGSATKLINLAYTLPSQYAERGQWLFRRAIEGDIRTLVDGNNRYMWPELAGSGFAGTPRTLLSYPVNNSEFMPNDGTDANKVAIFGDFSAYIIGQRAQISTVILRERFADTDQTGIILFGRVGGALWNEDAIRYGVV
jgi:HK97 family phage major capsid protein